MNRLSVRPPLPACSCQQASLGAAILLLLVVAFPAAAQDNYLEIREDAQGPITENRLLRSQIGGILRNGRFNAPNDEQVFNDFFRWRINSLTWSELRKDLPEIRREIKRQWLNFAGSAPVPDLHTKINDLLLLKCSEFADSDEFHPAVRVNAMLLIGMLDEKEPDVQGRNYKPLDRAFDKLLASLNDPKLPEVVRAAAFPGLKYHLDAGVLAADRRRLLIESLTKILATTEPPSDGDPEGHLWLRYRSADLLADLMKGGSTDGGHGPVAAAMQSLAADRNAPISLRIRAAYGLGTLDARSLQAAGVTVRDMAINLGELAARLAQDRGAAVDQLVYYLQALNYGLRGIQQGRGLKSAAASDTQPLVDELDKRTAGMLTALRAPRIADAAKLADVRSQGAELQTWLAEQRPASAETGEGVAVGDSTAAATQ